MRRAESKRIINGNFPTTSIYLRLTIGNVVGFLFKHAVLVNFADGVGYLHGSCRVDSLGRSEDNFCNRFSKLLFLPAVLIDP